MLLNAATILLSVLSMSAFAEVSNKDMERCAACYNLAELVSSRMKDTEARSDEQVPIGVRLGPNGEQVAKKVVRYGDSEKRLLDVLDNACDNNPAKSRCNEILHDQEELINEWFHSARDDPFAKYVCDAKINGCNAKIASDFSARKAEEKEAAAKKKEAEKATESAKKVNSQPKKAKKESAPKTSAKKQEETAANSFDPMDIVMAMVNRFKGNMQRIYRLSGELYREMSPLVKARNWDKIVATLKSGPFYQKYWIVFAAFFFGIYFIISLFEPLFAKKPARSSSKKKAAAKAKKDN